MSETTHTHGKDRYGHFTMFGEFRSAMPDEKTARECAASPDLLAALKIVEKRLTACARALYVDGKPKAIKAAFEGWKDDIEPARAAIAKATQP